jgi:hypothetical protein
LKDLAKTIKKLTFNKLDFEPRKCMKRAPSWKSRIYEPMFRAGTEREAFNNKVNKGLPERALSR